VRYCSGTSSSSSRGFCTDFSRRIDARMVGAVAARLPMFPGCAFVCGSNAFAAGGDYGRADARRNVSEGSRSYTDAVQNDRRRRLEGLLP
jgi:hypothetical protein